LIENDDSSFAVGDILERSDAFKHAAQIEAGTYHDLARRRNAILNLFECLGKESKCCQTRASSRMNECLGEIRLLARHRRRESKIALETTRASLCECIDEKLRRASTGLDEVLETLQSRFRTILIEWRNRTDGAHGSIGGNADVPTVTAVGKLENGRERIVAFGPDVRVTRRYANACAAADQFVGVRGITIQISQRRACRQSMYAREGRSAMSGESGLDRQSFNSNYTILKQTVEWLSTEAEPDIDQLLPKVELAIHAYAICRERLEKIQQTLGQSLAHDELRQQWPSPSARRDSARREVQSPVEWQSEITTFSP
jgi:hypothetical protein